MKGWELSGGDGGIRGIPREQRDPEAFVAYSPTISG